MSLPEFSTRYPVTITMATFAVVLLGWISLAGLATDLLPNVQTPVVTVDLKVPGKSPQEMEERYTRRLERDISTVSGVDRVYSMTRSGQSVVVAEVAWDTDMDFALLDVQKRMGAYSTDDEIETLDVTQEDPQALPVARIAVSAPEGGDLDELLGTVDTLIKPRLEALDGVASAEIEGDAEKEIRIILDEYLLEAFGLTATTVVQRIQQANQDVSGGRLEEGDQSYQVKGLGRLADIGEVENLIVGERAGSAAAGATDAAAGSTAGATGAAAGGTAGATSAAAGGAAGATGTGEPTLRVPVYVHDVGRVVLDYAERQTIVRLNGIECLGLAIYKEADASTVSVVQVVLEDIESLALDLPGIEFTVVENQARFIEQAVQEVEEAALYGVLLAVGVLLLFLRSITATVVIGLAIPISVLATFTLMYFQNLTLNIMTMGGLALGAGMLVDNAIVVIENIYRRLELGAAPREAASRGASEVGIAILASTLTTVSVFLPIVYVQGLVGELFKEQAWTVAFSLLSSLVVAMTVVPMLASRVLRQQTGVSDTARRPWFRASLTAALNHKFIVLVVVAAILGVTVQLALGIQMEFIPREDQGLFNVDIALPESTRLEMTDRVAARVGSMIDDLGGGEVSTVYARSGIDPARVTSVGDPTGPNRASLSVAVESGPRRSIAQLVEAVDAELAQIPDLEVKYQLHETALEGVMGAASAPIQLEVVGDDLDTLRRITDELAVRLEELPAVYNVRTSFQGGQPEIDLRLREDVAAAFGLTPQTLIGDLERRLSGEVAGELTRDTRSRDIRVGFEDVTLSQLADIRIDAGGAILTLGDIADPRIVEGPREILREGQRRMGRISGYLVEGAVLSEATAQVNELVDQVLLPTNYRIEIGGEERERAESFGSLGFALALSVLLVYMVMASLFESILHPFTVMLTVPLAGIGVVITFWALNEPLSVMAYIGIIMLGGIAVNDAIILVDHVNQLRLKLPTIREAVVRGAADRLRPIMMTSATTILALGPMAIGLGEGAQLRAPMAIAVIGGLVTSTLMTLVVIPVVYELVERLRRRRPELETSPEPEPEPA